MASARTGRVGQVGIDVDVRRPGDVPRGVLPRPARTTRPVADVEDRDVAEYVSELAG
jgi:hypothetical protein